MAGNDSLTSFQVLPGSFGKIQYNSQGGGTGPNTKLLIIATMGATAQRTPNRPFLPSSQQDADDGCEKGSEIAWAYEEALSQPEAQGCEAWLLPVVEPSGGVKSNYVFKVYIPGVNPTKPGTLQPWISSRQCPAIGFTTTDTAATIAAALRDSIKAMTNLPIDTANVVVQNVDEVLIPYRHKGATGEDLPFRINLSPNASGVNLAPARLKFTNAVTTAGSVRVNIGSLVITTAIANLDTAAQVATKVAASFNADTYPVTAVVDGGDPTQVDLYFANDDDVRRVTASIITSTVVVVNAGSGNTDGTGSASSFSYNGTLGTGIPSLTLAMANLDSADAYRSWTAPWLDTTTLGTLATKIEAASNGSITGQKFQHLTVADWQAYAVTGAIPPAVSPNLTTSDPHYAFLWSPDAPVKAFGLAARVAAARAALWFDTPNKNWNGFQVKGSDRAPILLPKRTPDMLSRNAALRTYALAPVTKGPSGNFEINKGRTTSLSVDRRLWAWSAEQQAVFHSIDLGNRFTQRFQGGSLMRFAPPRAPGLFDATSFIAVTQEAMRAWEDAGHYDGAAKLAADVKANPDPGNVFKMDVTYPESGVVDLDQVSYLGLFTSPSP